jgi:hypothetical protein
MAEELDEFVGPVDATVSDVRMVAAAMSPGS